MLFFGTQFPKKIFKFSLIDCISPCQLCFSIFTIESKGELVHLSLRETIQYLNQLKENEEVATFPFHRKASFFLVYIKWHRMPHNQNQREWVKGRFKMKLEWICSKAELLELKWFVMCHHFKFPIDFNAS